MINKEEMKNITMEAQLVTESLSKANGRDIILYCTREMFKNNKEGVGELKDKYIIQFYDEYYGGFIRMATEFNSPRDKIMYNKIVDERKKDIKLMTGNKCRLCATNMVVGNKENGSCNSHNIPQFVLKNIVGKVNKNNALGTVSTIYPNINYEKFIGINSADTFYGVCKKCDAKTFVDYETPSNIENFTKLPSNSKSKIMNQISLKVLLKDLWFYTHKTISEEIINLDSLATNNEIDLLLRGNIDKKLIYSKTLNYNTGFSVQDKIIPKDLFGKKIPKNIYMPIGYRENYIYVCVYPVGNKTYILMFRDMPDENGAKDDLYGELDNYFRKEKQKKVLKYLSYLIIKHTEKIFFNPEIFDEGMWSDKDKVLAMYEYDTQPVINSENNQMSFIATSDYLKLKNINMHTVTNLFNVAKKKRTKLK